MAGASRDRVTITLGRRGQVVRRVSSNVDASFSGSSPVVGAKRSIRDRLGSNGSLLHGNGKRQRGDIGTSRAKNSDGTVIDKGDLRLKLMMKNASKKVHRDSGDRKFGGDLRDKLKRARKMPIHDSVRHPDGKKESGGFGQATSARSSDGLPKMQPRSSRRDSYSDWGNEHYGRGSPGGDPHTSIGISPQRSVEDIHRRPLTMPFNGVSSVPFMSKSIVETTRPMGSGTFQSSTVLPPLLGLSKPIGHSHLSQLPPPSSIVPKVSYMVDEQQTVDGLLHSLGLGKYVVIFKAEEVDMTALKQMGENDLKELGIPMGPRKKILLALL